MSNTLNSGSATTHIEQTTSINLDAYFAPHKAAALERLDRDQALITRYLESGKTIQEFADSIGKSRCKISRSLTKYNVPSRVLNAETIRRIRLRARKRRLAIFQNNCPCIAAQIVRQELERQVRAVQS